MVEIMNNDPERYSNLNEGKFVVGERILQTLTE